MQREGVTSQMLILLADSPKVQTCYVQSDGICLGRPLEEKTDVIFKESPKDLVQMTCSITSLDIASNDALYTRTE